MSLMVVDRRLTWDVACHHENITRNLVLNQKNLGRTFMVKNVVGLRITNTYL